MWAAACLALPLGARACLEHRIATGLEPALSRALGAEASVGGAEAGLTGTLALRDVALGAVLAADAVEASAGAAELLAGELAPAELRLVRPRLRIEVRPDGASDLDPILARARAQLVAGAGGGGGDGEPGAARRLRRLVVTGGDLEVELVGRGALRAAGVEIVPLPGGARLRTGRVELTARAGGFRAGAAFARGAADLALPALSPARLLAVGGQGWIAGPGGERAALSHVTLSRDPAGALSAAGRVGAAGGEATGERAVPGDIELRAAGGRVAITARGAPLDVLAGALPAWLRVRGARASGSLALAPAGGALRFSADARVEGVALHHRRLAGVPVPVSADAAARGAVARRRGALALALDEVRLSRGEVAASGRATLAFRPGAGLPARADLELSLPPTACDAALEAIPAALRPALTGLALTGEVSARLRLSYDTAVPERTELDARVDLARCAARAEAPGADPRLLTRPFDHRLPGGGTLRVGAGPDRVVLARLPAHVAGAFVAAEDARFFRHRGFDLEQIERSLAIDLEAGRLVRGGSTITQQLVKNTFLDRERTVARKLQEAILTWRVESRLGKQQILERYLDLIELGPGVFGLGRAARHWFGVAPEALTARQAAFLAALAPAPGTFSRRLVEAGALTPEVAAQVDLVLRAMRRARVVDRAGYERARAEPLYLRPAALARR